MDNSAHVFPFLWMHGESHEVLAEEIQKIAESGIKSFCAESRTHEDFCRDKWWEDFGFVLREAKKRNMTVWLLDDKHYPTGYANGGIERNPHLAPTQIMSTMMDVRGPSVGAKILLREYDTEKEMLGVFAFKSYGKDIDFESGVDLSAFVSDGVLFWDVPEGVWRVIAVFTTQSYAFWKYVDVLNPRSADLMISEIYQPHYDHFSEYFGNTFVGFFSDEPRFGNGPINPGTMMRHWTDLPLGVYGMTYPWGDVVNEKLGLFDRRLLVSLWYDLGEKAAAFRIKYMDIITECYAANFSERLGNWCAEHSVHYTGHIIEDNGAHTMSGCSAGHFFRSMRGQDIAGIDVVYNVLRPGFSDAPHICRGSIYFVDEKFYQYTLPKLAQSAAKLEPRKKGRAMCEIFGAYGWGEGVTEMKWLVDFMLSRGINYFVPHAFNPLVDDTDCPPYFYNGGFNPQFEGFGVLMRYTERMCEILSGGESLADVAVLYHAEAEWSGARFTRIDGLCKALTREQILFDIVTEDQLKDAEFSDGIKLGGHVYKALIIPEREYYGLELQKSLTRFERYICVWKEGDGIKLPDFYKRSVYTDKPCEGLSVLRYKKDGEISYFIFNESVDMCEGRLHVPECGTVELKDEMTGFSCVKSISDGAFEFSLLAGESRMVRFVDKAVTPDSGTVTETQIRTDADIAIRRSKDKEFMPLGKRDILFDVAQEDTRFAGKIKYSLKFDCDIFSEGREAVLDFGKADGAIFVTLNGKELGERIAVPFAFDVTDIIRKKDNEMTIVYSTTLALVKRDRASHYIALPKFGFCEYPKIRISGK